jgi:hypothetical protein
MVRPREAVAAVRRAIEESNEMPESVSYLEHEPDTTGDDASIKLPVCAVQTIGSIRIKDFNTDQVSNITDDNGNVVGRKFEAEYRLDTQIDLWVAAGSSHDPDLLGNKMRTVLYNYDSAGPQGFLKDENGENITSIWKFEVGDGERRDDLTMNPSLRRWMQEVTIWANEEFSTVEDYIAAVDYPADGDFSKNTDGQLTDA